MKKFWAYFCVIFGVIYNTAIVICFGVLLSRCDPNGPLRNQMLEYYSQDDHYVVLSGEIKTIKYVEEIDELILDIYILTEDAKFPHHAITKYSELTIVNWSNQKYNLAVGNTITFTSAPMFLYNGHIPPIVHIEKDGKEYLSFAEGKEQYLNWINETFK